MKTEYNKYEKIYRISKTILAKGYNSSIKQKIYLGRTRKRKKVIIIVF